MLHVPDRITIDRRAFITAARIAHSGTDRWTTIPVLGMVKVTANGTCAFEATDLDQCIRTEIPYAGKPAQLLIPNAESLAKAMGAVGGTELSLADGSDGKPRLAVRSGDFAADLESIAVADHPGIDRVAEEDWAVDISPAQLAQIARVMPAISSEETRYYLNGICVWHVADWTFRFVATDGHRLFVSDVSLPGFTGTLPPNRIIPKRWWNLVRQHLAKTKEPLRLAYGPKLQRNETDATLGLESPVHRVSLRGAVRDVAVEISTKLIDGTYPDVARVIPLDCTHHARLRRADLVRAINALQPLSTEKTRAVKLSFLPDALRISLHSPTVGDCAIDIPASHGIDAAKCVGFNARYLLDACNAFTGDEVTFSWEPRAMERADAALPSQTTNIAEPTLLTDPSDSTFFAVLMPMRV